MNRVRLHVNVDHVATVRQARGTLYPQPVHAAALCELAGADGITVHLREDRRHIQDHDVRLLRETVRTVLNLEMAATEEMTRIAAEVGPDIVTLVPEKREERTTEAGLDLRGAGPRGAVARVVESLRPQGIEISLFVDPEPWAMEAARELGADIVELHTGEYCESPRDRVAQELTRLVRAAEAARKLDLRVAAGHGLDYPNVEAIAAIPGVEELNIGHALIARAVFVGLDQAVRDMIALIDRGASRR